MTAMTDVAFLLLTFFMLTAKAKPQETVIVDTPSSISETKLPDAGTLTVLVSKEGNIHLDMAGSHTRLSLIEDVNSRYTLGLNEKEKMTFASLGSFGVPRSQLKKYLDTEPGERGQFPASGFRTRRPCDAGIAA